MELLQEKCRLVEQAASDGFGRSLWNTGEVVEQLYKLHVELFQAFTLQMLTAQLCGAVVRPHSVPF